MSIIRLAYFIAKVGSKSITSLTGLSACSSGGKFWYPSSRNGYLILKLRSGLDKRAAPSRYDSSTRYSCPI